MKGTIQQAQRHRVRETSICFHFTDEDVSLLPPESILRNLNTGAPIKDAMGEIATELAQLFVLCQKRAATKENRERWLESQAQEPRAGDYCPGDAPPPRHKGP